MASLTGLRIVVTRAAHQAEELAAPLRELGADVILLPTIAIGPPADVRPLQEAARRANDYDWIIFTSQNSVAAFSSHLATGDGEAQEFKVAAIGKATRDAAEARGVKVHLVPEKYVAESLADAFASEDLAGKHVLIPSAAVTRDVIPRKLEECGAIVSVVEAYTNVLPDGAGDQAARVFREPLPDWILFASSSAVEKLVALVDVQKLQRMKIGTIGPITSATVQKFGLSVAAEANPHDIGGMVNAVVKHSLLAPP
jgi:uroporphyrinogen-III synthase